MSSLLRQALEAKGIDSNGKKLTKKEIVTNKLAELAANGDVVAIKEINNRIDGMPTQTVNATITVPVPIYGGEDKGNF